MEDIFDTDSFWRDWTEYCRNNGVDELLLKKENVNIYDVVDSTNSKLLRSLEAAGNLRDADRELTPSGEKLHLSLVACAQQTAGRGRLGRRFYSPSRTGVYFSFVYAPKSGVVDPTVYTITSVVGVCRAIERLYGVRTQIKWVNDVYINGKKVCGILTEGFLNVEKSEVEACVVGIGINLMSSALPEEIAAKAGGIEDSCDAVSGVTRSMLLSACMAEITSALSANENIIEYYKQHSMLIGERVMVTPLVGATAGQYEAKVLSITDGAGLEVELLDGSKKILKSGEVTLHQ